MRSPLGLTTHLGIRRLTAWAFALALARALFNTMSGGLSDLVANNLASATYVDKMTPEIRPVVRRTTLLAVVMMALVDIAVVQWVLGLAASEERGLSKAVLACGVPRMRTLVAAVVDAISAGIVLPLVSGVTLTATTATRMSENRAVDHTLISTLT